MVKFKIIEPPDFSDTATTAVAEPANVFRGGEEEKKPSAPKLPKEEKVTFTIPKPPSSEDGVASPFSSPRNDAIREGRELEQKKITNIKADSFFRKLKKISEWNYKQGERAEESGKLANLQWAGKITIEEMLAQDIELQKKYANMGDDPTPSWEQNKFWDIYGAGVKLLPFQFGAFKKGAIGAAAGWLVGAIATPFMPGDDVLLAAAGAKLGPKLAGAIGKKAIQATGARVGGGSAVVNYSMNIEGGNIYIDLIKRGVDPELAKKASRIGGLAIGLVEVAKFGAIAKFLPGIGSKAVRAALKTSSFRVALGKALKEWGSMYGQEVSEEYIQKVIENATIMAAEALDDGVTPSYRDVVDKLFDNAWVEAKAAAKGMLLTSGLLGGAAIGTSSVGSVLREKAKESTRRQVFEGTKSGTAPDVLIGAARMRDNLIGEELKEGVAYGEDGFFHKREGRTDKLIEEKDLTERQKEISYLDQAVSNKASNAIAKKYGIRFKKFGERDNFKWKLLKDTLTGTKVKIAWKGKPEIVDTEFEVVGNEGSPQTGKYDALTPEETKDVKGTALKLLNNFTKKGKKGKPGKPVVTYDELTPFLQARLLDYIAKAKESGVTEADMETGPFLSKFFVGIKDKEGNVLDHGTKNLVEYIGGQLDVEGGDIKVWLGLVRGLVAIKDIPGFLAQAGMKFSDLQFVALKLKGYSNVTKVRATILAEVKKQAQQQKDLKDTIDDSYYVDIDSQTDSSDSSTTKPVKDVSLPEQEGVVPSQTVEKKVETEAVEVIEKIKQDNATKKSNRNLKKGDEQTQAKPTVTESKGIGSTIEQMPGLPRGVLPRAKFGLKTKVRFTTINALRRRLNKIGDIRDSIKIIATDSEAFANGVKIKDSIDKDFLAAFITDDRKTIYINKKVMDIWWKHYSKRKKIKGWNRKSKSESGYWLLDLLPKGMSKREFFRFAAEHEMVHLITGLDGEQIDELLVTVLALERIGRVEDAQYLQQFASITRAPLQKLEKIIVPLEDIRGTEGLQYQTTQKDLVDMSNVPCKVNPVYLDPDNLLEIDKMAGTNQSFSSSRKAPIAKKKILTELNQGLLTDEWRQENIVSLNRMVDEFLRYHPSIEGNTTTKAGVNKIINNFTPDEKLAFYKLLKSKDKETGVQNVYLNHEVNDGTITPDVYNNVPGEGVNFWGEKVGGEKPEAMQDGDAYNNNMKVSKVNNTEDQIRNELGWKIKHFYEAISGLLYAKRRISRKVAKTAWEKKRVNMKLSNGAIHKLTLFLKQHGVNEPIADTDTGILNQLYATGVFKESSESYPRAVGIWYNEEIYDPKWPNKQRAMAISSMPLCKNELANLLSMNDQNVKFHEDDINDRIAHQGALWQLAKDKDGNAVNEGSVVDRIDKVTEEETVQITEFINDQVDSVGPEIIQEEETAAQKKLRHDLNVFWADRRSSDLLEMQKIMQEISDDEAGKLNAPEDIKKETDEEYYGMEGDESEDSVGEVEIQDGLFGLGGIFGFTKKGSGDTKTNNTRSPSTEAEQFRVGIRMLLNATRFFGANDSNVLDAIDHYANPNWTKKIPKVPSKLRGVFHEIVEPLMLFRRSATTSALYGAMMVNVVVKEIAGVADKDMGGKRIRSGAWLKRYKFYSALLCRAVEELQPGNKYSEIGKGGPHNTPVIARNYLKDMTHFWNATHDTPATPQQEQGWLNNRDPLSFTTLLPTELQGLVAWVQNEIAAPLLQEQLDKGIFDSASTYALRREGWFRRWANIDTDEKGKQQTAVSSEIPAKREYYAFSDFIDIAENKAHMDAAQDFAAICGEYVTGSLNKLTKANILQEFLGMTALDEEHPDWTLVMYATKVKVPAVVNGESTANWTREEKGAWKNGYLQDRGFTQMKSAPGLAGWSFGKFQAPWVHSSVANLIRTFTETSRKSQWLKSWFAINRIVKLMVMFTPFMYMMQIVSTPFAWVPRLLPKTIKGVAMMLPAGLKQSVLRFQGRKDPFSHLKGQNYDYKKLYWLLQAGLPGFNVDYAMKALFEREIDLSHPMTKTILHNAYKVVRSKGGMEDYAFDRFIASHIYALSSKFYDDFMARGWGEEVSARRAAMLVGDITGMVNSSIYGNEGQFLQAFLFARDFTMTFFRQVTGALGLKFIVPGSRDFQTGPRHVFNSLLHGEKSVADMQALQPLYFAHLMKIMMWRISLVNMTQFGLMMMLGDEEDKKKPWAYQNSGTMSKLFIKLPWKNKEGKQMYLDPLMLREPSQLIGWPTKPGRMFRGKMNYAVSVAWDLMKNRDYRDRLIYPESSAMGVSEGFRTKKKARYVWDAALPTAFDKNAQFQGWWFQVLSSLGLNVKVDHWTEKGHSKDEIVAIKGWQATLRWLNDDFSRFLETTTPQEQLELASRGKLTPTQLFNLYKKRNFRISSVKYDEAMTLYKSLWKYRDIIDLPTARRDIFSR